MKTRAQEIARARERGETFRTIAERMGISQERVRQILMTPPKVKFLGLSVRAANCLKNYYGREGITFTKAMVRQDILAGRLRMGGVKSAGRKSFDEIYAFAGLSRIKRCKTCGHISTSGKELPSAENKAVK